LGWTTLQSTAKHLAAALLAAVPRLTDITDAADFSAEEVATLARVYTAVADSEVDVRRAIWAHTPAPTREVS